MKKTTEESSKYRHLEKMSIEELLININREDQTVPLAIKKVIPAIEKLVAAIVPKMRESGRLFYLGAGTSGRLAVVDASECPPTFGVPHDWVIALIAGGSQAILQAVEHAEDDIQLAWKELEEYGINDQDVVVGIAASGTTPYVVNGLKDCREHQITTGCITCNYDSPLAAHADFPIEIVVGPEFLTASTRMKAGTAQKLILNMISTSVMIQLGRVKDNVMVDMQLSNDKLIDRGTKMIMKIKSISYEEANALLLKYGGVRKALEKIRKE